MNPTGLGHRQIKPRSGRPIRVQLAEDHEIVRTGFRYLLDYEHDMKVVAESSNGIQACQDYDAFRPDVLVLDISMPDMNGLETIRRILAQDAEARILILSMHTALVAERALRQGARGFFSKQCAIRDLVEAIRRIMQGERYLDAESAERLSLDRSNTGRTSLSPLSKRETEVCMLLVDGRSVSSIAERLHMSEKTVYTHREHILRKLGVATVVELVQLILFLGMPPTV
jgi:two-component system, NarL family, invasion response regulator UvrY